MRAGPGSNAPHHGGSGLLPTPTPRPMMQQGQGPRPQVARSDMVEVQGGGSLGPGRPSGPTSSSNAVGLHPNAGRGDSGRGMPMGPGRPSGGRGGGGVEQGGRGRVDNSMVGMPPQGPQRSPTVGPVPVNGNDPRALGLMSGSGSGAPGRPYGPMGREGNGVGIGTGIPRHEQQDGRPSGGADGAQGARQRLRVVIDTVGNPSHALLCCAGY